MGQRFRGVYPVLYAFFDRDGRLDHAAMCTQVEHCIAAGAHGITVLGLVTEVHRMTTAERQEAVELVGATITGRVPYTVTIAEQDLAAQIASAHSGRERCVVRMAEPSHHGSLSTMIMFPYPYRGFHFPAEIIEHAVWLYHCFSLNLRDVELILAGRGLVASYETRRARGLRFDRLFANALNRRHGRATNGIWTRCSPASTASCTISGRRRPVRPRSRHPRAEPVHCLPHLARDHRSRARYLTFKLLRHRARLSTT